jgi:hypothetical protein
VFKASADGFFSAALAVLLVAAVWFTTQPSQELGLLWGGTVYTSKQEFNGYLNSKGLSYKTWVVRNPGVAPWEPRTVREATKARQDWTVRVLLAAIGLIVATGCALLLLRGLRTVIPSLAKGWVPVFGAVLAVLLVGVIWVGTQPRQEPGLLWGGAIYTSKEEFSGYLKSKGLSYKTWAVRNPDAAPWEPETVQAVAKARDERMERLLLAAIGWILGTGCAIVLLRALRPVVARFTRRSVVFFRPRGLRRGQIPPGGTTAAASTGRHPRGPVFSRSRGLRLGKIPAGTIPAGRTVAVASVRRLGVVASGATRRLNQLLPLYGLRLVGALRPDTGVLTLMRERNISAAAVAFGVLAVVTAVMFAVFVVVILYA